MKKESNLGRTAISITQELLEEDISKTIIDFRGGFPNIPEIMMQAPHVCKEMFDNLKKEVKDINQFLVFTPMWCAFAGIGAVAMWNDNWPQLRDKGIIESLIEERGYFAMDEYVMDYIGIGWGTEDCNLVRWVLRALSEKLVEQAVLDEETLDLPFFAEALKAMYMYGMIFEMSRLGMH